MFLHAMSMVNLHTWHFVQTQSTFQISAYFKVGFFSYQRGSGAKPELVSQFFSGYINLFDFPKPNKPAWSQITASLEKSLRLKV